MAKTEEGPAKGETKSTTQGNPSSPVKDAKEVTANSSIIQGSAPGTSAVAPASDGIVLEGLGNLSDVVEEQSPDDVNAGAGPYVVVLNQSVSGVGRTYGQGKVRKL